MAKMPYNPQDPNNTGFSGGIIPGQHTVAPVVPSPTVPAVANPQLYPNAQPVVPSFGSAGKYGEGAVFDRLNFIKNLKTQLDAGQISVADYLNQAHPVANDLYNQIGAVAGKGSTAANIVNPVLGQVKSLGFDRDPTGGIVVNLGPQYEADVRKALYPNEDLSKIPTDININSDQGKIERQNAREQQNQLDSQKQQQSLRDTAIGGLQDVLGQQNQIRQQGASTLQQQLQAEADRQFGLSQPGIYEDLNSRGLLSSSAVGDALARERGNLYGDVANRMGEVSLSNTQQQANDLNQLSAARLSSTDQQVKAIQQALLGQNQLQQQGLQRTFGIQDFATQAALARQIAEMSKPQQQGGNSLMTALGTGLSGAAIGAQVGGGPGALVGGLAGAGAGYGASKSGGGK